MDLFYKNLMTSAATSIPMVDGNIVERSPTVPISFHRQLCAPATKQEVKDALFSMDSLKSPGIDGYNVTVTTAVQAFFIYGKLVR